MVASSERPLASTVTRRPRSRRWCCRASACRASCTSIEPVLLASTLCSALTSAKALMAPALASVPSVSTAVPLRLSVPGGNRQRAGGAVVVEVLVDGGVERASAGVDRDAAVLVLDRWCCRASACRASCTSIEPVLLASTLCSALRSAKALMAPALASVPSVSTAVPLRLSVPGRNRQRAGGAVVVEVLVDGGVERASAGVDRDAPSSFSMRWCCRASACRATAPRSSRCCWRRRCAAR